MSMRVSMYVSTGAQWGPKRASESMGLELQVVVSLLTWMLGTEPGSSERARGVLNHKPSLQPCVFMFPVDVWCAQDIYVHSWPSQYPHWGVVWLTLVFRWQWWGQCELTSCAAKTHGFQGPGSADAVLHRFCEVLQVIHYTHLEWWQYINTRRESPSQ